jgi:hypothetical protein
MSKCSVFKSRCLIVEHVDNQFIVLISARLFSYLKDVMNDALKY